MKISIVLRDITERGGGERVCANLANALIQEHEVRIISFYHQESTSAYPLDSRIKLHFLTQNGERSGGKICTFFKRIFYRYILTLKAMHYFQDDEIVLANDRALAPIFKQKRKKYIRLWHLNFPKKRKNLSFFDALVVLANKELHRWREVHPNVWVIPNFLPFLPEVRTDYTQKTLLSVGRMDRGDQKGFLRLIDIFALVAKKHLDWKLVIVGEGILKESIEKKIREYELVSQVILKPFTSQISQEYLQASFYVMTSYFEGLPMVLLECASYGLASVAFDIKAGPSDIIEDGKSGFLVEDGDLKEFASKMEMMMGHLDLRESMGETAQKRIETCFSQKVVLKQWDELFSSLQTRIPQSLK